MFIGEISKKVNIPVKTIRYYEEFGLLHHPKRSLSQYRIYTSKDLEKLLFIKKSKDLGLTLAEIKKIIKRSSHGVDATCCLVHEVFEEKIADCEQRIKELKETKHRLSERLHHWINPSEAKKLKFTICPQIETNVEKRIKEKSMPIIYVCPMHPEVKSNKPGKCSKCGMNLKKEDKKS